MVDSLYSLVEVVLGSSFILWGIALAVNTRSLQDFLDFLTHHELSPHATYILASLLLPWGLSIVWLHNEWAFDFPVIVTLVGWAWVIKCMLWLMFPRVLKKAYNWLVPTLQNPWFIRGYSAVLIVLGWLVLKPYLFYF